MAIETRTEESFTPAMRTEALEDILTERGLVDPKVLAGLIKNFEENVGPMNGARVVARAWVDPDFRARLLDDATAACAELGYKGAQGEHIIALENSEKVHNVVVCTLCSCYPWPLLGLPPGWYKDPAYRARVVREPRRVLGEFGLQLGDDVEIRVWDSLAEVRYLVLPQRPAGTGGLGEEELAGLVTRDAMVGIAVVPGPGR
jgi:nitrile hydratase